MNGSLTAYETPEKFKKQIRQRTYDCNRSFPESKELKCAIVNRVVGKMFNSPSTHMTMNQIMCRYIPIQENRDRNDSHLVHSLVKIQKYGTARKNVKFLESVSQLKKTYSIRAAARKLNMQYSHLHHLLKCRQKHGRALSKTAKENVIKSYSSTNMSMQLPFKKYSKFYYLRTSLAVAYDSYAREQMKLGFAVLSQSSVYRCLKGKFRIRKKIPFKDTQCAECVNNSLLVDALIVGKVKGIKRRITENVLNSYCKLEKNESDSNTQNEIKRSRKLEFRNEELITDHNRDCIFRHCKKCSTINYQESIRRQNPEINWDQEVTWHQWRNVIVGENNTDSLPNKKQDKKRKILDKVRYRGTLAQLLTLFITSLSQISVHLFHFRWQAFQFDECKKQLKYGDVLFVMDFATNYSHHQQDEIHGAFWCRNQTTLHPIVVYYPCPEKCDHLVRDEVMILSSDLKHDSFAVTSFIDKALAHLKEKEIPVKHLIMWSDNCGSQYKSCKVFDAVSKQEIPVMRSYFCARHGKAEADGAIGRLSMHIDAVVRSGSHEFSDASEIVRYCELKLTIDNDKSGMCCHWQRHYFEVSNILRDDTTSSETVEGTRSFHSVRNVGVPGIIEVRESSCFCEICFLNEKGKCRNAALVQPFAWTSLYKNHTIEENFKNKLWEGYSIEFKYVKKNMFRPKPRNPHLSYNIKKRNLTTKSAKKRKNTNKAISTKESDSEDSDYEYDIPLVHIKAVLKGCSDSSPIGQRTRARVRQNKVLRCENGKEDWDLEDYEGWVSKQSKELNIVSNNRQLGIMPLSPEPNSKINSLSRQTNFKRIKIQKKHMTKSSTPIRPSMLKSKELELSPIPHITDSLNVFDWNDVHRKLLHCKSFHELKLSAKSQLKKVPPLPDKFVGDKSVSGDSIDNVAMTFFPADTPQRFLCHHPVITGMDGNCFCRSISRLVFGSQEHHLQIRCRIVMDSVMKVVDYTDHNYLMRNCSHIHRRCSNIASYYCTYSGVKQVGNRDSTIQGIQSVFREDVLRIRNLGEYCGLWQFHSAANVLNSKITMMFPSKHIRLDVRVDHHREFWPHNIKKMRDKELGLLWTSCFQEPKDSDSDDERQQI